MNNVNSSLPKVKRNFLVIKVSVISYPDTLEKTSSRPRIHKIKYVSIILRDY